MNEIFPIDGYPQKRYDETRAAFRRLVEKWQWEQPRMIVETFAGMGGQTVILAETFPGTLHRGWELDPGCYQKLAEAHARCGDRFAASEVDCGAFPVSYFDTAHPDGRPFGEVPTLLVVDGAYSLAQHEDYAKYHDPRATWLIICEQARTRLHLHKKTYGLTEEKKGLELYEEYLDKVAARHDRPLLGYQVTPYSPAYVLLGPVRS